MKPIAQKPVPASSFDLKTGKVLSRALKLVERLHEQIQHFTVNFRLTIISIALTALVPTGAQIALADSYQLGTNRTVQNLGSPLSSANIQQQWMFVLPSTGDYHLLSYYTVPGYVQPLQIMDINLSQPTMRVVNTVPGRPGTWSTILHPNGKIYMSAGQPLELAEYDPVTGITKDCGGVPGTFEMVPVCMCVGYDGQVYMGNYAGKGGTVCRYNPTNQVFQNLGYMDTNYNAPQYTYTIGADSRYVYAGLGEGPWYLAIYDTQTTNTVLYWVGAGDQLDMVQQGVTNGSWYAYRRTADSVVHYYTLTNGMPTEIPSSNHPACYSSGYSSNLVSSGSDPGFVSNPQNHWANNFQVNADNAYPFTGSNQSTIKWQTFGSTNWQSITATNFFIGPVAIQQVIVFTNNDTLCCIGAAYVPAFLYTLSAGNTTVLGQPQGSLYDLIYTNNAGGIEGKRVFFSGYDGCLLDYNPTNPWTLTVSVTNQGALGVNPRNVAAGSAKVGEHYYYTCFGSDGWVYSACDEIRNAGNGSAIAWYDPVSKSVGSFRDRALTNDFTPTDLKPVLGGTKLVFVDTSGSFYVFDVATKTLVATNTPLGGIPLDKVVEVAPGIIFGATGSNIFLASVTNSAVFYTNTLPGNAFCVSGNLYQSQERLTLGPDGYIWLFVNNSLYRINPLVGTNTMTNILNTTARTMIFDGGDLIMFRNFDVNLYRIKNLLVPLVPPPILLTGAAKLPNGAFQFAFTNTPVGTNYITTNITTTITTNWSKWGPPKITGYTTNITPTLTTNGSANTATVLTTTNLLLPLTSWTVLGTVTDNPPGQFQFSDPQATNHPLRFYRVRSP